MAFLTNFDFLYSCDLTLNIDMYVKSIMEKKIKMSLIKYNNQVNVRKVKMNNFF